MKGMRKQQYIVPNLDKTHVEAGYEKAAEMCENYEHPWCDKGCEDCEISIPVVTDEYFVMEQDHDVMLLCGIPVGNEFKVGEPRVVGVLVRGVDF